MTPGEFIRGRRKALGIDAHQLADATELTLTRIRAIEEGARPDHWEAERLSAAIADDRDVLADLLDGRTVDSATIFAGIDLAAGPDMIAITARRDGQTLATAHARNAAEARAAQDQIAARLIKRLGLR